MCLVLKMQTVHRGLQYKVGFCSARDPVPPSPTLSLHPQVSTMTSFWCIFQKWPMDRQAPTGWCICVLIKRHIFVI